MLKKYSRDIQFFGISLKYVPLRGGEPLDFEISLIDYINNLKELTTGDNKPIYRVDSQKKSFCLQSIEFDEDSNMVVFLFSGGDKEIVDPAFWNDINNTIRSVPPDTNEKISFSCHMVLHTQQLPSGNYCLSKEIVPLITHTYLANLLNKISKENFCEKKEFDNGIIKVYPKISFNEIGSRTLSELLEGKRVTSLEAISYSKDDPYIDEDIETVQNIKKLIIKPCADLNTYDAIQSIKNIFSIKRNEYNEFYIRYTDNKQKKSVSFESDIEAEDIPQMTFTEKKNIFLSSPINQASTSIHQHLVGRMIIATREEHSYLSRTHNDSENEDDVREITASETD